MKLFARLLAKFVAWSEENNGSPCTLCDLLPNPNCSHHGGEPYEPYVGGGLPPSPYAYPKGGSGGGANLPPL